MRIEIQIQMQIQMQRQICGSDVRTTCSYADKVLVSLCACGWLDWLSLLGCIWGLDLGVGLGGLDSGAIGVGVGLGLGLGVGLRAGVGVGVGLQHSTAQRTAQAVTSTLRDSWMPNTLHTHPFIRSLTHSLTFSLLMIPA